MRAAALAALPCAAWGHSAVTFPPPRNAIDANEKPWGGKVPKKVPFEPWCVFPSAAAAATDPGRNLSGTNGQACFWFSNGCANGCAECDGSTRGPIPMFECVAGQNKNNCDLVPVANHTIAFGPKAPICANPLPATVCDPKQRTVNTGAKCGAPDDYFYYSPWRRPGSAPVIDTCGTAGGRIPGQGDGGFGAQYKNTTHAKVGDRGSKLPATAPGATWKAGSTVEVAWTLQANHGGGYAYRLCPAGEVLDEKCMQKIPLDFVGEQSWFRWGGAGGKTHYYNRTTVKYGTSPPGSMWAMNPVPRTWRDASGNWGQNVHSSTLMTGTTKSNQFQTGYGFQPFCDGVGKYTCTGEWGPYDLEILDLVKIPAALPAGKYVLGWRLDCEESNQIWQSCSDVEITA